MRDRSCLRVRAPVPEIDQGDDSDQHSPQDGEENGQPVKQFPASGVNAVNIQGLLGHVPGNEDGGLQSQEQQRGRAYSGIPRSVFRTSADIVPKILTAVTGVTMKVSWCVTERLGCQELSRRYQHQAVTCMPGHCLIPA